MTDTIEKIASLIDDELSLLNDLIRTSTASQVVLINQISEYIIASGGKRIRPSVLLLIHKALAQDSTKNLNQAVLLAAVIEFIHTSTLLHDDVVDESDLRRNQKSANQIWGNAASVLVGDFLYSRSFQMMLKSNNPKVLEILADTTNSIAEGEVLQLLETQNCDLSVEKYFEIINRKTAILFASSTQIAALIAGKDKNCQKNATNFGMHIGRLFQIVDDTLDYFGKDDEMGKNLGDDWAERKVTLPLICAFQSKRGDFFKAIFLPISLKIPTMQ